MLLCNAVRLFPCNVCCRLFSVRAPPGLSVEELPNDAVVHTVMINLSNTVFDFPWNTKENNLKIEKKKMNWKLNKLNWNLNKSNWKLNKLNLKHWKMIQLNWKIDIIELDKLNKMNWRYNELKWNQKIEQFELEILTMGTKNIQLKKVET